MPSGPRTYFDYNASAPLLDCALEAMRNALGSTGNASSVHHEGRQARKQIETARSQLAALLDCEPANVVFTSGATEAANHALNPKIRAGGQELDCSKLYVGATEHPCVMAGGKFGADDIAVIPVTSGGIIDAERLKEMLLNHDHSAGLPMVAVQLANNETGVVQPITELADIVHEFDGIFVVDAVQALAKLPLSLSETAADMLVLSSHKIGGPQGAGALVLQNPSLSPLPLLKGGGQENYHRGGTENVAAIAGFGTACAWHNDNMTKNIQISAFRDSIEARIDTICASAGDSNRRPVFFGADETRLGNTSCFSVPGMRAETAIMSLDLDGISVSSGSACSSGKVSGSHVLQAMGASEAELEGAMRLSLGWDIDEAGADHFLSAWDKLVTRLAA